MAELSGERRLRADPTLGASVACAVSGIAALLAGLRLDPVGAYLGFVHAYVLVGAIAAGAALLTAVLRAVKLPGLAELEQRCRVLVAPVPILALLLVPVLLGASDLYPWAERPQFLALLGALFGADGLELACRFILHGAYVLAGGVVGAGAIAVIGATISRGAGETDRFAPRRGAAFADRIGRLLSGLLFLWVYFALLEGSLLVAGVGPGALGFQPGWTPGAGAVLCILLVGTVTLASALLLVPRLRRAPGALTAAGAWALLAHSVDVSFLVLPARRAGASPWLELAGLMAVGGLSIAYARFRRRR